MGNCLKNVVVVVVLLLLLLLFLLLLLLRLLPLVVVVVLLLFLLLIIIIVVAVVLLLLLLVVDFEFHDVDDADLDVQHSDTHTLPFKPCCFFFSDGSTWQPLRSCSQATSTTQLYVKLSCKRCRRHYRNSSWGRKMWPFLIFLVPRKLYLGCDIKGANELGVIYFPANWGAKECQNLPKHRVGMQTMVFLCTFLIQ